MTIPHAHGETRPREEWFVDGTNVLHAFRPAEGSGPLDLPGLARDLACLASEENLRIWIVLDGKGPADELAGHRAPGLEVVYAQSLSADTWIERALYERSAGPACVVVTGDAAVSRIARGTGARVWTSAQLAERLKQAEHDRGERLRRGRAAQHGFHRPFENKL